jgi:Carboxypeptidase regulatory-like domain
MRRLKFCIVFILCISFTTFSLLPARAQSTVATGSIQGTVIDPNGAVVPDATVTITNKATGQANKVTSSASGTYASGALIPGDYQIRIEAKGFQTQVINAPVQVGNITSGNAKLVLGQSTEVVEVTGSAVTVNTEQATVQGVLTTQQIENLPINGRNFLDLAQLEPGVQIQDGGTFDPTKNGFSSISFGGRFGRTARIEVDGIDISDETVGTTTQNIPASAIQEFQVSQSSLDLSTELTSSGAVNVVTRSGSNKWHGEGFYLFRDSSIAARIGPSTVPFQRNNFGGQLGGPIFKDKMFFFVDAERLKQDETEAVINGGPFAGLNGSFSSPFRDTSGIAKLDWRIKENVHAFYRFSYEQNHNIKGFIQNSFSPFDNVNNTPVHAAGIDFNTGSFTHAIRFGYTKFRNGITDATNGVFNPAPGLALAIGQDVTCLNGGDVFCSGSNPLAPQKTYQQNLQVKYDGSKTIHTHILRYGFGYNRIQGGGFASFFGLAPIVSSDISLFNPGNAPFAGGASNPLNYPVDLVIMGNGQGFSSEKPAFGLPGGGLGPDHRIQWYMGDSWKIRPNLTLNYGLRYVHDTGRTDSDLAPIPCSQLDAGLASALATAGTPCNGNILDLFGQGLGNRIRNPGRNFGPTAGFAWDPTGSGKTVIRAGAGIYYENSIFNSNLFNRPGHLAQGLFFATAFPCAGSGPTGFTLPSGAPIPANLDPAILCGQPIGSVATQLAQLQTLYQSDSAAVGASSNPNFIGNTLAAGVNINGGNMFAPNYQTPRSLQMNIGFERQIGKGVVLNADYIRNIGTHTLLAIDVNHVGDARFFNKTAALNAITATNAAFGCGASASAATINCAIAAGATIVDYANSGLDSGTNLCSGGAQASGICSAVPAFGGINPQLGVNQMLFPAGRSVYNAFQTSLRANVRNPFMGVRALNWIFSYSLSRYLGSAQDSDFINNAIDNNNPTGSLGPNGLDRTHQLSFGGTLDFPGSFRFGTVAHVYSPLSTSLFLPGAGAGGIFISDVTGDGSGDGSGVYGSVGDLVPGTKIGAYGRKVKAHDLAGFINNFNNTIAGQATPAGQTLINNGLFTLTQLQQLQGVIPLLDPPLSPVQSLGWLKTVDLSLAYPKKLRESLTIEPRVTVFNAFNMSNFDASPKNSLVANTALNTGPGSANGSTPEDHLRTRVLPGSGVFSLGSPRVVEFGLKLTF